jgi:hypothetical protein
MSESAAKLSRGTQCFSCGRERSPLAHLLHALKQPLTGLQCSLELAAAGPQSPKRYAQVLDESLELTARMRALVHAIGDLMEIQQRGIAADEAVNFDALLREVASDWIRVAETRGLRLLIGCESGLCVQTEWSFCRSWLVRLLDSVLSLAHQNSAICVRASRDATQILLTLSWEEKEPPQPLSGPELGLLIAQSGCERMGARWERSSEGGRQVLIVRLPSGLLLQSSDQEDCE